MWGVGLDGYGEGAKPVLGSNWGHPKATNIAQVLRQDEGGKVGIYREKKYMGV